MDNNYLIQYTLVCICIAIACIWIIFRVVKKIRKKGGGGCCGCSLSEKCNSRENLNESKDCNDNSGE